ncbi:MAG: DUF3572 domain-containing protein [Rhizomicrobium sp.]
MALRMTPDRAQILALKALGFLANSEDALDRFTALSGLDRGTLRERAGEAEMLASVLDFLLSDEALLVDFCHGESCDPKAIHMARHVLGGS